MGRKRHLLLDTLGLILAVVGQPANLQDRDGARLVLRLPRRGLHLKVVKRTELHTFKILPSRWGVERTLGWLSNCRRLAKDYEFRTENSEAMILIAATRLMLRRIA